ncbi:hypothetical protein J5U18_04475 [Sphingobacteriaceae bacterium WQ 2009]|uniref:Colicin E3-like ribonuclease domain-containing protein n=1 Tax=Rhinopithecimicrobium faecis TaxID=2820698 RepID=A0A8T4H8W2_9SPHI|nr:hypothetical protein [Sphingobacteriaceae bacterium WQ 2009]
MGGKPIPSPCFLDTCEYLEAFKKIKRWRSIDRKKLFTWDALHGEIEVFNYRGAHLGVYDLTGVLIKNAVKGRKIDV